MRMSDERESTLREARRLIEADEPAAAVEMLQGWLADAPDDVRALSMLCAAQSKFGNPAAAERAAKRVVQARPNSAKAWLNWGITLRMIDRRREAVRALRKALKLDPDSDRARRELAKLRTAPARKSEREVCPVCGEPVFATDTECLACGADLLAARAEAQRKAEERAGEEAARRERERREEAERAVARLRAGGFEDEEIYRELTRDGRAEDELRELLGVPDEVWIISLPEDRVAFVASVDEAKMVRQEALDRMGELRSRIASINREVGELRQSARATRLTSRTAQERAGPGDELDWREQMAALEQARADTHALMDRWEQAIQALDAWIASQY